LEATGIINSLGHEGEKGIWMWRAPSCGPGGRPCAGRGSTVYLSGHDAFHNIRCGYLDISEASQKQESPPQQRPAVLATQEQFGGKADLA